MKPSHNGQNRIESLGTLTVRLLHRSSSSLFSATCCRHTVALAYYYILLLGVLHNKCDHVGFWVSSHRERIATPSYYSGVLNPDQTSRSDQFLGLPTIQPQCNSEKLDLGRSCQILPISRNSESVRFKWFHNRSSASSYIRLTVRNFLFKLEGNLVEISSLSNSRIGTRT